MANVTSQISFFSSNLTRLLLQYRHIIGVLILISEYFSFTYSDGIVYQFQFQCYEYSLCTYPLEYCSAEIWERRCIPCLPSVCKSKDIPLSCRYNCSLVTGISGNGTRREPYYLVDSQTICHRVWFFLSIGLMGLAVLLVIVVCVAVSMLVKHRKDIKISGQPENETKELLITGNNGTDGFKNGTKVPRDKTVSDDGDYGERKLKGTPVVRSSEDAEEKYKPTTHLQK